MITTDGPIPFDDVLTNIGGAYLGATGMTLLS